MTVKQPVSFNIADYLMDLKTGQSSQKYLEAKWRLAWLRDINDHAKITILKSQIDLDREFTKETSFFNKNTKKYEPKVKTAKGWAYYEVRIEDDQGAVAEASGSETAVDFDDFIEKACTKAISRALGELGYGTQYTGREFHEEHRITDAPVSEELLHLQGHSPTETVKSTTPSLSSSTPQASKSTKVIPAVPLEKPPVPLVVAVAGKQEKEEETRKPTWQDNIQGYKENCGLLEWNFLKDKAGLPEDETTWTAEHAFQLTNACEQWMKAGITEKQQQEIALFRKKYGKNVGLLKASIEELAKIENPSGFMRSQAEFFLGMLREADEIFTKHPDPDMKVAKDLDSAITHPLLFACPDRTEDQQNLYNYQSALEAAAEDAA